MKKIISAGSVRFLEKTRKVSSLGKQKYQVTKLARKVKLSRLLLQRAK